MERIEIAYPRGAPLTAVVTTALLLAFVLYILYPVASEDIGAREAGTLLLGVGLPAVVLFEATRAACDRRPLLAIDDFGVASRVLRPRRLPWTEIAGAHRRRLDGGGGAADLDLLCIQLADPRRLHGVLHAPGGLLGWLIRRQAASDGTLDINLAPTGADVDALVAVVNARACGAGGGATSRGPTLHRRGSTTREN